MNLFDMKPNTGADGKPLESTVDPADQALVDDIPYEGEEAPDSPTSTDEPTPTDTGADSSPEDPEEESKAEGEEESAGDLPIAAAGGFSYLDTAEGFVEEGILIPDPEKEYEDSPEGFQEVIRDTVKAQFEATYGSEDGEHLAYLAFIKNGGTNQEWVAQTTLSYADVDLEDEDTQKELLTRQYQAQGISQAQITKKLTRLEANGTLEEEAKDAQEYLLAQEEEQAATFKAQALLDAQAREKAEADYLVTLQSDIEGTEVLAGIPLNPALKKGLYAHLTKPVGPKGETQYQLNQKDKTKALSGVLLDFLGLDTEDLSRKTQTKKATTLQKTLQAYNRGADKSGGGQTVRTTTTASKNAIPTKGMPWGTK